jgi:dynein heavy chain, axonemal
VKTVRQEKTIFAMNIFVENSIGKKFTEATISTMDEVFADTDYKTPLIFILS